MFGHQDDQPAPAAADAVHDEPASGTPGAAVPVAAQPPEPPAVTDPDEEATIVKPEPDEEPDEISVPVPAKAQEPAPAAEPAPAVAPDSSAWQHPGTPLNDENEHEPISDIISPAGGFPKKPSYQYPAGATGLSDNADSPDADEATAHELVDIKQQALGELSPLIDKLDLPPEEKFHTIMMMVQASDDQTLVRAAYTAAHSIEDEKARAQALLDIINEVNYFTHQPEAAQALGE